MQEVNYLQGLGVPIVYKILIANETLGVDQAQRRQLLLAPQDHSLEPTAAYSSLRPHFQDESRIL